MAREKTHHHRSELREMTRSSEPYTRGGATETPIAAMRRRAPSYNNDNARARTPSRRARTSRVVVAVEPPR